MDITLNIGHRNESLDQVLVYRSQLPLDVNALPPAHATLPGSATSYVDSDVVLGGLYHYIIETVKDGFSAYSPEHIVAALPHFGPGSQELLYGNHRNGYFGKVAIEDMISNNILLNDTGLPLDCPDPTSWFKFIFDGKVVFIPDVMYLHGDKNTHQTSTSVGAWWEIYDLGLIFGQSGPGPQRVRDPVDQLKLVEHEGQRFKVRTMHGGGIDYVSGGDPKYSGSLYRRSEAVRFFTSLYGLDYSYTDPYAGRSYDLFNGGLLSNSVVNSSIAVTYSNYAHYRELYDLTADLSNPDSVSASAIYLGNKAANLNSALSTYSYNANSTLFDTRYQKARTMWRPVLELHFDGMQEGYYTPPEV